MTIKRLFTAWKFPDKTDFVFSENFNDNDVDQKLVDEVFKLWTLLHTKLSLKGSKNEKKAQKNT